jgi:hypothetical protein
LCELQQYLRLSLRLGTVKFQSIHCPLSTLRGLELPESSLKDRQALRTIGGENEDQPIASGKKAFRGFLSRVALVHGKPLLCACIVALIGFCDTKCAVVLGTAGEE